MANNITLHNGDSAKVLKQYPDNHFDSIVTDPPYGIEFLGKDWDDNTGAIEVWQECLRVLKPGAYMLAFSAPRTYHRLTTNLEDIGFEIKDQVMWLYGQGFPKAQDVGKKSGNDKWAGWKTGLKPSHEPIVMCRKPLDNRMGKRGKMKSRLSVVENVEKWGVGALNIDATRIIPDENDSYNQIKAGIVEGKKHGIFNEAGKEDLYAHKMMVKSDIGRFPSNVIGEVEGYQKYFYHPKVNKKERHIGNTSNTHPTIKPVALMLYLVKMITPPNGKVLDPFNGSGSTGMAVKEFGGEYVGIDLDENYIEISKKRIETWN